MCARGTVCCGENKVVELRAVGIQIYLLARPHTQVPKPAAVMSMRYSPHSCSAPPSASVFGEICGDECGGKLGPSEAVGTGGGDRRPAANAATGSTGGGADDGGAVVAGGAVGRSPRLLFPFRSKSLRFGGAPGVGCPDDLADLSIEPPAVLNVTGTTVVCPSEALISLTILLKDASSLTCTPATQSISHPACTPFAAACPSGCSFLISREVPLLFHPRPTDTSIITSAMAGLGDG